MIIHEIMGLVYSLKIVFVEGADAGRELVSDRNRHTIGRGVDNDFVCRVFRCRGKHSVIIRDHDGLYRSAAATVPLSTACAFRNIAWPTATKIKIGHTLMRFEFPVAASRQHSQTYSKVQVVQMPMKELPYFIWRSRGIFQ